LVDFDFDEGVVDEVVLVIKFVAISLHISMVHYFFAAVAQPVERPRSTAGRSRV
jgi:hypothetical protein